MGAGEILSIPLNGAYISRIMKIADETASALRASVAITVKLDGANRPKLAKIAASHKIKKPKPMSAVIISPLPKKGLLDERQFSMDELFAMGGGGGLFKPSFGLRGAFFRGAPAQLMHADEHSPSERRPTTTSKIQTIRTAFTGQLLSCLQLVGWRQRAQS